MIPYGRQSISEDDIRHVVNVLRSEYLTQGPAVSEFETKVAAHSGALHAVATNSATSALHIACIALGLGPGDWLWTTPITFVASANCALYCGARIDFVDIDPQTYNLSVEHLEKKLVRAEREGCLPKIVVPVHLCGQSCDMKAIGELGRKYGFRILEDASHAIGGTYQGEAVGNCRHSDITVFSFHPVKIVTTGEGGMALTNNSMLAERMSLLCSHGITRDPDLMTHMSDGPWYYQQLVLGFNYRMSDIHAALGMSQMTRICEFVARRQQLAARYDELLRDFPVVTPWQHPDGHSSRHLYIIRFESGRSNTSHLNAFQALREAGVGVNLHYIPVYLQPYYRALGFSSGYCPEAERYYAEAISLPIYYELTDSQQDDVVSAVRKVFTP